MKEGMREWAVRTIAREGKVKTVADLTAAHIGERVRVVTPKGTAEGILCSITHSAEAFRDYERTGPCAYFTGPVVTYLSWVGMGQMDVRPHHPARVLKGRGSDASG